MNYEEHNKLIELAASNEALAKELAEANSKYTKQMQAAPEVVQASAFLDILKNNLPSVILIIYGLYLIRPVVRKEISKLWTENL